MAEHSPTPWRVAMNSLGWATRIADSNGHQIASCWGGWGDTVTEPAQSDAALIVEAVNERDRLRDLVRRLADSLGVAVYALRASALFPGPPPDPPHDHLNGVDITALLDEAREVTGEAQ